MTLADRLASTAARAGALELMLCAHVALDRGCLKDRAQPKVSPTARRVLDCLSATPAGVPLSAEAVIAYYARLEDEELAPIAQLAFDAAQLTVEDLSFLSRATVLELVGALPTRRKRPTKTDRLLELSQSADAA